MTGFTLVRCDFEDYNNCGLLDKSTKNIHWVIVSAATLTKNTWTEGAPPKSNFESEYGKALVVKIGDYNYYC